MKNKNFKLLTGNSLILALCTAYIFIILIGCFNYLAGPSIAFSIFYLIPISIVIWFINPDKGIILSLLAICIMVFTSISSIRDFSSYNISVLNIVIRIIFFTAVTLLIANLKRTHEKLKESLREKEILFKEIHHRVKNNMAIISNLLFFQENSSDDDKTKVIFREARNRIKSMLMIHEKLYESENLAFIDFGLYTNHLVEDISKTFGKDDISLSIEAEEIYLEMDKALSCALIINEVVTNALKHAFSQGDKGTISISLTNSNNNEVCLMIKDNGKGISSDNNQKKTLGFHLIEGFVQHLKGTFSFCEDNGTKFTLLFKNDSI